jgi:hypothetical protein
MFGLKGSSTARTDVEGGLLHVGKLASGKGIVNEHKRISLISNLGFEISKGCGTDEICDRANGKCATTFRVAEILWNVNPG